VIFFQDAHQSVLLYIWLLAFGTVTSVKDLIGIIYICELTPTNSHSMLIGMIYAFYYIVGCVPIFIMGLDKSTVFTIE